MYSDALYSGLKLEERKILWRYITHNEDYCSIRSSYRVYCYLKRLEQVNPDAAPFVNAMLKRLLCGDGDNDDETDGEEEPVLVPKKPEGGYC